MKYDVTLTIHPIVVRSIEAGNKEHARKLAVKFLREDIWGDQEFGTHWTDNALVIDAGAAKAKTKADEYFYEPATENRINQELKQQNQTKTYRG